MRDTSNARVAQLDPVTVDNSRLVTGLHPKIMQLYREGTLAPDPWYIRHPVLTVGGVLAAGGVVWLLVRHMRKE
jgi:hypothetical protein